MAIQNAPISVVVPCWRSGDTIRRAVTSIAEQTIPPVEIILVDDASGDDTLATLQALAAEYPDGWIKVIGLEQNSGPGGARNAGWDAATQPWIAFLDADDAWHPRKIEIQYGYIESNPSTDLCGHMTSLSPGENIYPDLPADPVHWRVNFKKMLISNRFPTRSVILRRSLPFRFGDRSVTEDYLLWLQVILSGYTAYRIDAPLAVSFRPEFSGGGYSGQLWRHEMRELAAWRLLRKKNLVPWGTWIIATCWSLIKYIRRVSTQI